MDVFEPARFRSLRPRALKLKRLVAEQILAIDANKEFTRGLSKRTARRLRGMPRRIACLRIKQPPNDKAIGEELVAIAQQSLRVGYRRPAISVRLGESRLRRLWRDIRL